jgi:hypothetical protein
MKVTCGTIYWWILGGDCFEPEKRVILKCLALFEWMFKNTREGSFIFLVYWRVCVFLISCKGFHVIISNNMFLIEFWKVVKILVKLQAPKVLNTLNWTPIDIKEKICPCPCIKTTNWAPRSAMFTLELVHLCHILLVLSHMFGYMQQKLLDWLPTFFQQWEILQK